MRKETVVEYGLCTSEEHAFGAWRDEQRKLGFLEWETVAIAGTNRSTIRYRPGKNSARYVNDFILDCEQVATQRDLDAKPDRSEFESLQAQIDELTAEMKALKERLSAVESVGNRAAKAMGFVERLARATLGDDAPEEALNRLIENMLDGRDEEEAATPQTSLLAN
jgi:hypothetical protein